MKQPLPIARAIGSKAAATPLMKTALLRVILLAASLAPCTAALALDHVFLEAKGNYTGLGSNAPITDTVVAPTFADWNAMGLMGRAETGLFPNGSPIASDQAEAFADFTQASGYGIVRSKAAINAFYSTPAMAFSAEVEIHLRLRIENLSSSPANIVLGQFTHGTILSGGAANSMKAYAEESLHVVPRQSPFGGTFFHGSATVLNDKSAAADVTNVTGDWLSGFSLESKPGDFGSTVARGVEINVFYAVPQFFVPANTTWEFDIDFTGLYKVFAVDNLSSSFYSLAEADFSNTGTFDFRATDPLTGLPRNDVSLTIAGQVPVPEPGVTTLLALAVCAAGLQRKRR